jgi:hypothetical protein
MVDKIPVGGRLGWGSGTERRLRIAFAAYVGELTKVIGHEDREGPQRDYCSGLLATEGRRLNQDSVVP